MKTSSNLSGGQHQLMLEMLAGLTPAERRQLKDPDFITEDEADIIISNRRSKEPSVGLDQAFAEIGLARRRRQKA
jgi:hypothetical protein